MSCIGSNERASAPPGLEALRCPRTAPDRLRAALRNTSHARRVLLHSVVFRLLDLLQLGLDFRQCSEDLAPGLVLILQAVMPLGMMCPVPGLHTRSVQI